jgi:hypothetical protein
MQITKKSPITGKYNTIDLPITEEQYITYKEGISAELVFPGLSREHILFLERGISPEEKTHLETTFLAAATKSAAEANKLSQAQKNKKEFESTDGIVLSE